METCPHCNDIEFVMDKVYVCHIDDYAEKVKNTDEKYIEKIEKLQNEIDFKDKYIKEILKTVNTKLNKNGYKKMKTYKTKATQTK